MSKILILSTCIYAHEFKPHLPQVFLTKGKTYTIDNIKLTQAIADKAVASKFAEHVSDTQLEKDADENKTPITNDEFDPRAATHDEMKAFVQADEDLDELIDLRIGEEDLRTELISLLEGSE